MASVINRIMKGTLKEMWSLDSKRDFVHVEDVAESVVNYVKKYKYKNSVPNRIFDVGTGFPLSFREIVQLIGKPIFEIC